MSRRKLHLFVKACFSLAQGQLIQVIVWLSGQTDQQTNCPVKSAPDLLPRPPCCDSFELV